MNRPTYAVTNQDEFNQNVVRLLGSLYILTLPHGETVDHANTDIAARDRLSELDAYAWKAEYERFNGLSEDERDAELSRACSELPAS